MLFFVAFFRDLHMDVFLQIVGLGKCSNFCNHKNILLQVLDDSAIAFFGRVFCDTKTFTTDIRVTLLRLLAYGAIQDDFSIILHMDRKDHFIMNYAKDFESIPILEQEALALFVSILFIVEIKMLHFFSDFSLLY